MISIDLSGCFGVCYVTLDETSDGWGTNETINRFAVISGSSSGWLGITADADRLSLKLLEFQNANAKPNWLIVERQIPYIHRKVRARIPTRQANVSKAQIQLKAK